MNIDEKLIDHLALLARLELAATEKNALRQNLAEILDYVEQLKALDTDQIQPLVHTLEMTNVFRPDEVKPGLTREDALKNAPEKEAGFFKVPRVIE